MYKDAPASETDRDKESRRRRSVVGEPEAGHHRPARSARARRRRQDGAARLSLPRRLSARPRPAEQEASRSSSRPRKMKKPSRSRARACSAGIRSWRRRADRRCLIGGAAGYVYWDYAAHFESTDDAFIAARQFAIAPKVAGYVTAVPVTDNQHVNKGDVIARIDQRDYRDALAQAQAQVAGGAGRHPQHRRADRDARRADRRQPGAGRPGAGEPRTREGHLGTRPAARQAGLGDGSAGHDRRPELSRPSRPLSTARKRRSRWPSGRSTR